ncbi:2-amino-4-hydroxy-6-hydroxymethyldihydropteridine diphosphokinase [Oscillospiraceae bacterium CM]|nr:2-amino-4-hydroxy-6-hydroxymethyldihydropteridine diphosphokinase [Oscillospiraceae bacterium CM]
MNRLFLSLGSNLGDRAANIQQALTLLSEQIHIIRRSPFYETEPVGFKDQPWFLNIAVEAETTLAPLALLCVTQGVEQEMKRVKTIVNGPRIIDVDILLYNNDRIVTEQLVIPHPRMLTRAFVLKPLCDIAPSLVLDGKTIREHAESVKGEDVRLFDGLDRVNAIISDPDFITYTEKNIKAEASREFCRHDLLHAFDVARIAAILNLEELHGFKKDVLYALGLLHDVGRWREYDSGVDHAAASAELAEPILSRCGFDKPETDAMLRAIESHRKPTGDEVLSGLLYRADKLSRNCRFCKAITACKKYQNGETPRFRY